MHSVSLRAAPSASSASPSSALASASASTRISRVSTAHRPAACMHAEDGKGGAAGSLQPPSAFAATRRSFATASAFFDEEGTPASACLNILGRTIALPSFSPASGASQDACTGGRAQAAGEAEAAKRAENPPHRERPSPLSAVSSSVASFSPASTSASRGSPARMRGRGTGRRALGPFLGFPFRETSSCLIPDFLSLCFTPSLSTPSHELTAQFFVLDCMMQSTAGLAAPVQLPLSPSSSLSFEPSIRCALHPPAAPAGCCESPARPLAAPAAKEKALSHSENKHRAVDALKHVLGPCVLVPPCVVALPLHAPMVLIDRQPAATPALTSLFFPPSCASSLGARAAPPARASPASGVRTPERPSAARPDLSGFFRLLRTREKPLSATESESKGTDEPAGRVGGASPPDATFDSEVEKEGEREAEKALELIDEEFAAAAAPACPFHAAFVASLRAALARWLRSPPVLPPESLPSSGTKFVSLPRAGEAGTRGPRSAGLGAAPSNASRGVHVCVVIPHLFFTFKSGHLTTIAALLQTGYQRRSLNRMRRSGSASLSASQEPRAGEASGTRLLPGRAREETEGLGDDRRKLADERRERALPSTAWLPLAYAFQRGVREREDASEDEGEDERACDREGEKGRRNKTPSTDRTHDILLKQQYVHGIVLASYLEVYVLPKATANSPSPLDSSAGPRSPRSSVASNAADAPASPDSAKETRNWTWGGDLVDVAVVGGSFGSETLRELQRKFRQPAGITLGDFVSVAVEHFSTLFVEACVLAATGHAARAVALFHSAFRAAWRHIGQTSASLSRPLSPFASRLASSSSPSPSPPSPSPSCPSPPFPSSPSPPFPSSPSPSSSFAFARSVSAEIEAFFVRGRNGCPPLATLASAWRRAVSQWVREEASRLRAVRRRIEDLEAELRFSAECEREEACGTARLGPWWRAEQQQAACTAKKVARKSIDNCVTVCCEIFEVTEMVLDSLEGSGKAAALWTSVVASLACLQGEAMDFVSELLWLFPSAKFLTEEAKEKISQRLATPPRARRSGRQETRAPVRHRPVSFSTFGKLALVSDVPPPDFRSRCASLSSLDSADASPGSRGEASYEEKAEGFSLSACVAKALGVERDRGKGKKGAKLSQEGDAEVGVLWRLVLVLAATAFERAHAVATRLKNDDAVRWEVAVAVASFLTYAVQLPHAAACLLQGYHPGASSSTATSSLACSMLEEQARRFLALCSSRVILLRVHLDAQRLLALAQSSPLACFLSPESQADRAGARAATPPPAARAAKGEQEAKAKREGASGGSRGKTSAYADTLAFPLAGRAAHLDRDTLHNPGSFSHLLARPFASCLASGAPSLRRETLAPGYLPSPPNSPKQRLPLPGEALSGPREEFSVNALALSSSASQPSCSPSPSPSSTLSARSERQVRAGPRAQDPHSPARREEEGAAASFLADAFSRSFAFARPNAETMLRRAPAPPVDCSAYLPSDDSCQRVEGDAGEKAHGSGWGEAGETEEPPAQSEGRERTGDETDSDVEKEENEADSAFPSTSLRGENGRSLDGSFPESKLLSFGDQPAAPRPARGQRLLSGGPREREDSVPSSLSGAGVGARQCSDGRDTLDRREKTRLFELLKLHLAGPSSRFRWIAGSLLLAPDPTDEGAGREEGEAESKEKRPGQIQFLTGCVLPTVSTRRRQEERESRCISSPSEWERKMPTGNGACAGPPSRHVSSPCAAGAHRFSRACPVLLTDLREENKAARAQANQAVREWTRALAERYPELVGSVEAVGSAPLVLAQALGLLTPCPLAASRPLVGLGRPRPEGARPVSAGDSHGESGPQRADIFPGGGRSEREPGRCPQRVLWVCRSWDELESLAHVEERSY
ncbi:conserved hypothetical protein [Neospora caninum Liverpool]|uniref:Uncharacterized protein n=1 Tax=Neospora caninum (strain Liverpool) TaxID=572307 RepID=F0V779_NEOCL|nr:conserved hypothetical protein [Neospora caninum Liverpool]CBZ49570.1 conserved hypothetical protein [Neospora caninum Liverpool]|eukprot:XP_003879605.1 conserved hypothetical protein [Neospora caninum Liverpool]